MSNENIIVIDYQDKQDGHRGTYIGDKGLYTALFELAMDNKEPRRIGTWSSYCKDFRLREEVINSME